MWLHVHSVIILTHVCTQDQQGQDSISDLLHTQLSSSWHKPWVTSEEYLSSLSCVQIWVNGAICRDSRITTVDCGEERGSTELMQKVEVARVQEKCTLI